ncbi:hypothetical protein A5649_13440 [Mycolicibacter heraklionensis]|uniref:Uncharacterized protein n=1 Tax=Mycolicibacter heraklionensis TaxID=512402 RepID=A0AA91F424_9MYCO|nr:hypothetical protein [Mycolicibacter heraklionensis]OBK89450.1 hypothetical protein A5649_13440 [Mycolicibacter heraklionensis]
MKAAQRRVRDQRIRRLVAAGKSYRQVAAAVGLRSPASVHAIVHRGRELSALERWRANGIC